MTSLRAWAKAMSRVIGTEMREWTGKTIRIFLAGGEPTGILLAEIGNWTGKVLVAPRSQLDQLSKREEVRRTGVYLLVGPDPDDPSRALASIGEGDNVFKRLQVTPRTRPRTSGSAPSSS